MNTRSILILGLFLTLATAGSAHGNTITVNWPQDDNTPNDGRCTLREAVQAAQDDNMNQSNQDCAWGEDTDTIVFAGSEIPAGTSIILNTQIQLSSNLIIRGPATIEGTGSERLFRIGGSFDITFRDLTLTKGNETGAGGALLINSPGAKVTIEKVKFRDNVAENNGGAISSSNAKITIRDSEFTLNQTTNVGGALRGSNITIEDTLFNDNTAELGGGAIYCASGSQTQPIVIRRSAFESNTAWGEEEAGTQTTGGGAIMSNCHLQIEDSEFVANMAFGVVGGGAIMHGHAGVAHITRSVFRLNSTGFGSLNQGAGGAIFAFGQLFLDRSVLTDNVARSGRGGGALYFENSLGSQVSNSVLMGNIAQMDENHFLQQPPQQPSPGGAITVKQDSEIEIIHSTIAWNYGESDIDYHTSTANGFVAFQNSLIVGAFTKETCGGDGIFYGGETVQSGGNLQSQEPATPTCPEVPTAELKLSVDNGDFGVSTPSGLLKFDYPAPDYFGPAIGAGVATFCSNPPISTRDLLNTGRNLPCDIGAVEVPTQ
ncbi:MAG: CSLREA domain-containing protein [Acidobacteriota bacterium]